MIASLDRKLLRDVRRLWAQVLAIALVIASGVALLIMSLTALEALQQTARAYYERYRFAQVFAPVKRAPEHVIERIRRIPGVQAVQTRVVHDAVLDVSGFEEPVIGRLVSVPEHGEPALNRLALQAGRTPRIGHPDEAVLAQPFADAHGLEPGDTVRAIVNNNWRELEIVGIALSPEFVYTIGPGALMPDDLRFGVLWLGREALQAAYDLDGAFNDVSLAVLRGTDTGAVINRLDELLAPYGGIGAYDRADQISNWFLSSEIDQLETMSRILPTVFLAVAAFLTNMVLARLVAVERSEIGLLKAFGYRDRDIAWHYMKLVLVIAGVGIVLGWIVGYWLGLYNTRIYADFYKFPFLLFAPGPRAFVIAAIVSAGAAVAGTLSAVRKAAALPPAEAMMPPAPPLFTRDRLSWLERILRLDQATRILLRQITRFPGRALVTSIGIGMAIAVLITSMQWLDAIDHMVDVYFRQAQTQDVTVGFVEARSDSALWELENLPGVLNGEPFRSVRARLRAGHMERREALQGVPAEQQLFRVYDASGRAVTLPDEGLVLSTTLAELLHVGRGDRVTVEVLEGRRPVVELPVAAVFETYIGTPAYIELGAMARLMHERPSMTGAHLTVDSRDRNALFRALKEIPEVSAVSVKRAAIDTFYDTMGDTLLIYVSFFVAFACALAFGVAYNASRIALSERGRELATLRVLGFTRAEISYLLLGEMGLLSFFALPLGCVAGYLLVVLMMRAFQTELYRVPRVIEPDTFAIAMLIGLGATAVSALLVRRRVDHLDLVAVLKTRE